MSLLRQIWLAVITSTVIAFAASFVVSMLTARNYMESQLAAKNRDNANSLALSITQLPKDLVNLELQVSAQFDQGQYELIRLTDPEGKVIIEKVAPPQETAAPKWFVDFFPITSMVGQAQIANGWSQFAKIELVSQRAYVYQELWNGALKLLISFLGGGMIVAALGYLLVRGLKKPLLAVVKQAEAISQRRFERIPLPRIPELKSVTVAMNTMVERLKTMFDEEALRLEEVRREANIDKLTGLSNRSYFLSRLANELSSEYANPSGLIFILRLVDLAEINRRLGREIADDIVRRTGRIVAGCISGSGMAGRLNGADFALFLPNATDTQIVAEKLLEQITDLASASAIAASALGQIGATVYRNKESIGNIMSRLDVALAAAEAQGGNSWKVMLGEESVQSTSMLDWKELIVTAINNKNLKLVRFPVNNKSGQLIHYECPIRLQIQGESEWLAAGSFMPMAARLRLTAELDLATVTLALADLKDNKLDLAINISGESIAHPQFLQKLLALFNENREVLSRIWLEIPETGVFGHFDDFVQLCLSLRKLGCKIGVEHFGHNFSQIGKLHNLGLDYLKVDGSFVRDINQQAGNQTFLKGLCSIAHNIGLMVIAEGVENKEELAILPELGFDGVTGPGVRKV